MFQYKPFCSWRTIKFWRTLITVNTSVKQMIHGLHFLLHPNLDHINLHSMNRVNMGYLVHTCRCILQAFLALEYRVNASIYNHRYSVILLTWCSHTADDMAPELLEYSLGTRVDMLASEHYTNRTAPSGHNPEIRESCWPSRWLLASIRNVDLDSRCVCRVTTICTCLKMVRIHQVQCIRLLKSSR